MQGCLNIYSRMPEKHIKPGLKIPDQLRLRHLSAAEGCFHRIGKLRIIQFCQPVIMHYAINSLSFFLRHIIRISFQIPCCLLHRNSEKDSGRERSNVQPWGNPPSEDQCKFQIQGSPDQLHILSVSFQGKRTVR